MAETSMVGQPQCQSSHVPDALVLSVLDFQHWLKERSDGIECPTLVWSGEAEVVVLMVPFCWQSNWVKSMKDVTWCHINDAQLPVSWS